MFCVRVFVCTEDFKNILRLDITMVVTLKCALIAGLVNIKVYVLSQTYNSSVNKKEKNKLLVSLLWFVLAFREGYQLEV